MGNKERRKGKRTKAADVGRGSLGLGVAALVRLNRLKWGGAPAGTSQGLSTATQWAVQCQMARE